ncbi:PH domain-containing protein [Histoplasma capsulatum G186AR]|uniref:PH domain-containing protein n=2 Tax=Ajellomyces capsulatus TaxID=5037 RepID=C0NPY5_AJECG|nr:PH domain-containing protein [Histoplasma capsulatum G186AR]EEH06995.1 PH domain-containing protein [Histoplasma capsulatum G186AR]KAG5293976.1 PH domain-containing protein [Histoplasma capsulatum]QSS75428.1 PH domain-containing protein [Histoplasma capsulatum G186AR]
MRASQDLSQPPRALPETEIDEENFGLSPDSYTARKLQHASPEHLHITSRRTFIGPVPQSWLQHHRKSWRKTWLGLKDSSSRLATFSVNAAFDHINTRQLTGFTTTPNERIYSSSFPQPDDTYENREPMKPTSIAPVDTSQEELAAGNQQLNHIESEHYGDLGHMTNALDRQRSNVRRSSTDHATIEEYFTPSESLEWKNRSGIFDSIDTHTQHPGILNADQNIRRQPTPASDLTPNQPETPFLSLPTCESPPGTDATESTTSLIPHKKGCPAKLISKESSRRLRARESCDGAVLSGKGGTGHPLTDQGILSNVTLGMVRFQQDGSTAKNTQPRAEPRKPKSRERAKGRRRTLLPSNDGEIIRAERMLVRIDVTKLGSLPNDFSENNSIKIETRISEKWREYLVACRRGADEETPIILHLYKTRVIPQVQVSRVKKSSSHEIPLTLGFTRVNLFSSLDKTIVIWHPNHEGTVLFIMRAKSSAHSMEWYTFLRTTLGWQRPTNLIVHVPDLDIAVLLKHPFSHLQSDRIMTDQDDNEGRSMLLRTMAEERAIAAGIIKTCMDTLSEFPEWASILKVWPGSEKMGLAWRRYDRLEWVHGANEERMYGTIAMRTSHELELRPKRHYPTSIKYCGAKEATEEPPPVEGFLILLTSQKGKHQRLGKSYSRRLYFHVQNQYLCFCRPGRAMPPPPPRPPTTAGSNIPTVSQLSKDTPMIYSIDPYPLRNGKITWLSRVARHHREQHDAEAYHESRRNLKNLERAEGYFDLCRVSEVRVASKHHFPEESHTNGGDVDFHGEARDSTTRGGPEQDHQSRSSRSFELVMSGGLVVEFRAYNMQTRDEWVQRLSDLVRYWTARTREDVAIMKSVRRQNLELLNITEDQEFMFEQFASTWEVSKAQTSPELFNICGISGCRTVKMSGLLYCKPRRRSAFTACNVILTEGQILCFQSLIRKLSGEETPHTHHEREWVLDLHDCYIYSGLITNSDLLYQNRTIDTNLPSQHASPRVYTTDGWTSSDEDIATCFVLWQNSRKSVFRSQAKQGEAGERTKKWKKVSTLGVPGRSIVFNTRSRAERDMWVLMIETEINRLQQLEDVRIVSQDK